MPRRAVIRGATGGGEGGVQLKDPDLLLLFEHQRLRDLGLFELVVVVAILMRIRGRDGDIGGEEEAALQGLEPDLAFPDIAVRDIARPNIALRGLRGRPTGPDGSAQLV